MIATLTLAAILLAQQAGPLDALLARHGDAIRRAKTYDELAAAAKSTLAELTKLIESPPDAESAARARAIACDILGDLGDFAGAEHQARKFLETWPKHEQVALVKMQLGQVLLSAGRDADARDAFQAVVRDHAGDPRAFEAKLRTAQTYVCEKKDEDAIKAFTALRAEYKGKPEEWAIVMQQALALQIGGKVGEGRALLEETVRTCKDARTVGFAKNILTNWLWIGKMVRPIEGYDLKGGPVKLDLAGGKVTILYFLGAAFPDFEAESGVMRKLSKLFKPEDVSLLAVAIDKDKAKLESDLARAGVTWPVAFDG